MDRDGLTTILGNFFKRSYQHKKPMALRPFENVLQHCGQIIGSWFNHFVKQTKKCQIIECYLEFNILSSSSDFFKWVKYLKRPIYLSKMTFPKPRKITFVVYVTLQLFCQHTNAILLLCRYWYMCMCAKKKHTCVGEGEPFIATRTRKPQSARSHSGRAGIKLEERESWVQLVRCKCFLFVLAVVSSSAVFQCLEGS